MKVITLDKQQFSLACKQLAGLIVQHGVTDFSVVVPIITGGSIVADEIMPHLPETPRFDILFQRKSTEVKNKSGLFFKLLLKMPRFISDFLRMAESEYLNLTSQRKISRLPEIPEKLKEILKKTDARHPVLIIDDSVDTGVTVASLIESIRQINPELKTVVAALTSTMPSPLVEPDICLYKPRTLVRFPWSKDYAGKK